MVKKDKKKRKKKVSFKTRPEKSFGMTKDDTLAKKNKKVKKVKSLIMKAT